MPRTFRIKGLCSPSVSAFHENGDLNSVMVKQYVQHLIEYGISNVFVAGTNGEGNSMSLEERKELARVWVQEARGKLSAIVIQIGANNLKESQSLARHAQHIGADAIACVAPAYYKAETLEDYVNYMAEVASAAPNLPFILYDIDFYTGITFDVSTFFTHAKEKIPRLCGVKHTSPNFVSISNTVEDHPDIQVILGSDEMFLQALAVGVDTTICNSYMGHVLTSLRDAFIKGDITTARREQRRALAVGKIRRKYDLSVPGGTKAILNLIGLKVGQPRLPLRSTPDDVMVKLNRDLQNIGFFDWTKKKSRM